MRVISAARTMNYRIHTSVFAAALLFVSAWAEPELNAEAQAVEIPVSAETVLESALGQMEQLVEALSAVVDAGSAAALAPQIVALYAALENTDFSPIADEDEELVAADFEEVYVRMEEEMMRLADVGCYGNAALAELCGAADEVTVEPEKRSAQPLPLEEQELPAPESGTEAPLQ